ncbi:hypothetical protein BpHYR1_020399 [Brachionus plicatilis]|uniref:Uncharacterized protein n=1 Tax=Brachionus plicatilis TaxID=10195 RepID=A0A3M7R6E3_BRAPC|nr:hypothetical protein BpHYR1_020399 [Brachionus plicatilis]
MIINPKSFWNKNNLYIGIVAPLVHLLKLFQYEDHSRPMSFYSPKHLKDYNDKIKFIKKTFKCYRIILQFVYKTAQFIELQIHSAQSLLLKSVIYGLLAGSPANKLL